MGPRRDILNRVRLLYLAPREVFPPDVHRSSHITIAFVTAVWTVEMPTVTTFLVVVVRVHKC